MKKLLFTAFCTMLAGVVSAQKAGSLYLGNTFNFGGVRNSYTQKEVVEEKGKEISKDVTEKEGTFGFGLNPEIGYFLNENISVGFQVDVELSVSKNRAEENIYGDSKTRNRIFSFGPTASYYKAITEKLSWAPRFDLGFDLQKKTNVYNDKNEEWYKYFGFSFVFDLAKFEYRVTDRLSINGGLGIGAIGFSHSKNTKTGGKDDGKEWDKSAEDNSQNTFVWGISNNVSSISLGFRYTL